MATEAIVENATRRKKFGREPQQMYNQLIIGNSHDNFLFLLWYNLVCFFVPFLLYRTYAAELPFWFVRCQQHLRLFFCCCCCCTRESHGGNLCSNKMHLVLDSFDRLTACLLFHVCPTKEHNAWMSCDPKSNGCESFAAFPFLLEAYTKPNNAALRYQLL